MEVRHVVPEQFIKDAFDLFVIFIEGGYAEAEDAELLDRLYDTFKVHGFSEP